MGSLDICSRESVIRRYDHEVKGRTIVKPLMGPTGQAPQDAAVVRLGFDSWVGLAVAHGIAPRYADLDAYEMSAGAFDEALRQIIAVGGRLPDPSRPFGFLCANDNFCVPDSVFDPAGNPDGKYKLAQLVRMCQALFDMAAFFGVPMTSGKDSMKNDLRADGVKILGAADGPLLDGRAHGRRARGGDHRAEGRGGRRLPGRTDLRRARRIGALQAARRDGRQRPSRAQASGQGALPPDRARERAEARSSRATTCRTAGSRWR